MRFKHEKHENTESSLQSILAKVRRLNQVEHAETLTRVKRAILGSLVLDDKTKQKVHLILIRVFKEIVAEEEPFWKEQIQFDDIELPQTFKDIFGGEI